MKFSEFKYERPDFDLYKATMTSLIDQFKVATNACRTIKIVSEINEIRNHIETMATLASIRHSIDTRDEFYDAEQNYWDEYGPLYEEVNFIIL